MKCIEPHLYGFFEEVNIVSLRSVKIFSSFPIYFSELPFFFNLHLVWLALIEI